jgi:hypothetical protein
MHKCFDHMRWLILCLAVAISAVTPAAGEEQAPAAGRAVDTDPANFVEGPFTLESGRSQIEWGAVAYGRDRFDNIRVANQSASAIIFRTALTSAAEFQLFHDGYNLSRTEDRTTGNRESSEGLGDVTLQLKQNIFGNDRGRIALGATMFAVLNTGHQDVGAGETVLGGSVVVATSLFEGETSAFSAHTQLKYFGSTSASYYEFSHSFIYSKTLDERNSVALETNAYRCTQDEEKWSLLSSMTLTHAFTDLLTLDVAATVGLNREAEDIGGFVVLTRWF